MEIDQAQVIDRSVSMLIADGTAAKMEVGEHQTFIVTNEIHNIDPFWKSGLLIMIICGFFAFS